MHGEESMQVRSQIVDASLGKPTFPFNQANSKFLFIHSFLSHVFILRSKLAKVFIDLGVCSCVHFFQSYSNMHEGDGKSKNSIGVGRS